MKTRILISLAALLTLANAHAMRWYSPNTGRWFGRDPIFERGGNNLYAFVHNHPTIAFDALGKKCCLTTIAPGTFQGPNGEDNSKFGHSILKCDNGAYVSLWPADDPNQYKSWDEDQDNKVYSGATKTTICFPCLDESKVQQWIDANKATLVWSKSYNCANAALDAVLAGLPDQPKPNCPCARSPWGQDCISYAMNILAEGPNGTPTGYPPFFILPSDVQQRIQALADNNCNKWKCVTNCISSRRP